MTAIDTYKISGFLLSGKVEGSHLTNEKLKSEFSELIEFYSEAGSVFQNKTSNSYIPKEEAEAALSWCNGIAEMIYYEELKYRGIETENINEYVRDQLWKRINYIKQGLQSNGKPREKSI